ncbi:MAG: hypothetical protein KIT84_12275 [Labilithrix sp.]|nr:hypothetical protein [Labilithrix sp.]MCW5811789.1 hypothetical protein [Labilithrix sp.]
MLGSERRTARCLLGALAILVVTSAAAAEPTAAERETARTLLLSGREKKKNGQHKEALADFEKAHAIMHVPTTGLDLGKTQESLGLLVEARATFLESARFPPQANEPTAFKRAREEAKSRADAITPRLATLTVTVPAGAKVKLDDSEMSDASVGVPLKVNPGKHQIVASTSSDEKRASVDLAEGETKAIELDVAGAAEAPPPPPPKPKATTTTTSTLVWIGGGVAAAGVVAGSITGIMAFSAKSDVSTRCENNRCPPSEDAKIDQGMLYGNISTVSFIVAGVGAGILVYGLLNPAKVEQAASRPTFYASPFGVAGTF